jgi:hypothetical protein
MVGTSAIVSCCPRHRASVRESAGNVRMTCGRQCFDLEELRVMALQSKHTPRAFVAHCVVND